MKLAKNSKHVKVLQIGAGLIGKHLWALVASMPGVGHLRFLDRDTYSPGQGWHPSHAGQPKAQVLAEATRANYPGLEVDYIVGDLEALSLGQLRCDVLLTALDSRRARIAANYAFGKLGVPIWIDAGVSAPSLVRVSVFGQGAGAPCYECPLGPKDYAADQSYPCRPASISPRTNSPEYLGALAASLQAAELDNLLSSPPDQAFVNRELIYDTASHKLFETRLERRETCRFDHQPLKIRQLPIGPKRLPIAAALALGPGGSKAQLRTGVTLEVPGRTFVRELACQCGERRRVLRLKGRFRRAQQVCGKCGQLLAPLGTGLASALAAEALTPSELARPLSSLGLEPREVIAIGHNGRFSCFELGIE